jgi:hypothetical protein
MGAMGIDLPGHASRNRTFGLRRIIIPLEYWGQEIFPVDEILTLCDSELDWFCEIKRFIAETKKIKPCSG